MTGGMHMYDDRTLWKRIDGELPEAETRALDSAAARDEALGRRIEELRDLAAAVRGGVPRPPPDFAARTVALALKGPAAPVIDLDEARRFLRRIAIAAAILGAVGLTYLAVNILPKVLEAPLFAQDPLGK